MGFFSKHEIEREARATGFVQRKSKLKAWMFLETLMFHFQNQKLQSLSDLCNDIFVSYKIRLKKQSLNGRFNLGAKKFVKRLLEKSISRFVNYGMESEVFRCFKRVRIKDSSSFDLPENMKTLYPGNGGNFSKAGMSIQFEYDLKTNNVLDLSIHPRKENDYKNAHDTFSDIKKGDLVIRDLGYIAIEILKKIANVKAFFLNRIKSQTAIFEKVDGKYVRVSKKGITKYLRKTGKPYVEKELYVGHRKFLPCRVIFMLIPDDKIKERKKRHLATSKRRGAKVDPKALEAIDLNIFITNTTKEQIPASEVFNIYKLRWQVELIFKTWKQICEINSLKKANAIRVEVTIYAQLLWIIMNWGIIKVFLLYYFKQRKMLLSIYKAYKTLKLFKPQIKKALHNQHKIKNVIDHIGQIIANNHFKEKRKGKIFSVDIMTTFIG